MGPAQKEAPPVGALGQVPRGGARGPAHGYGHGHVRRKGEACLLYTSCKETYKLPVSNLYRKVYNYQGGSWKPTEAGHYVPDGVFGYFVSLACNHCSSPACVANCPTGAMQKDEETGIVWTDHDVCIGCKTCETACPYGCLLYTSRCV